MTISDKIPRRIVYTDNIGYHIVCELDTYIIYHEIINLLSLGVHEKIFKVYFRCRFHHK